VRKPGVRMDGSSFQTGPAFTNLPYLLDTSAAILLRDDDPAAKKAMTGIDSMPAVSAVTKVELEGGVYARPEMLAQRRLRLNALLEVMEVIDFNADMATTYGKIVAGRGYSRRKIIDRMIAATALVHDLTLITTNPADFADIDGLRLEIWAA
jgi:tRNA(fMet)-specific endonuclease VapC